MKRRMKGKRVAMINPSRQAAAVLIEAEVRTALKDTAGEKRRECTGSGCTGCSSEQLPPGLVKDTPPVSRPSPGAAVQRHPGPAALLKSGGQTAAVRQTAAQSG